MGVFCLCGIYQKCMIFKSFIFLTSHRWTYCRDGLCRIFLFQLHGLSCIGQFRAYQICQYGFQEAVRLLPVKGLLAHEPSEGKGYAEVFQKCPVNERKGREVPQEHNCKHRYHEPRHLCERDGEWQLKIIDGIEYLFHRPDTGIASYFLHVVRPF